MQMVPPPTSSPGKFARRLKTKSKTSSSKSKSSSSKKKLPPLLPRSDSTRSDISSNSVTSISKATTTTGEGGNTTSTISATNYKTFLYRQWNKWQRKIPILKRLQDYVLRIPPRFRYGFVIFWFCWKIVLAVVFLIMFFRQQHNNNDSIINTEGGGGEASMISGGIIQQQLQLQQPPSIIRVLYIVTTLSEYNTGTRSTQKGQDRLAEILIPVVSDGVKSMMKTQNLNNQNKNFFYEVDVYLICAYKLLPEREQLIRQHLPDGVGLEIWDNAAPLGYDKKKSTKLADNTRALARQHRYVIKDKFFHYDLFVAFEDDMLIKKQHLDHYLYMSNQIDQLIVHAPTSLPDVPENLDDYKQTKFYGQMTKQQLSRIVPGFIRVEVLLNETQHGAQRNVLPIPRDYDFDINNNREGGGESSSNIVEQHHIHPEICCYTDGTYKGLPLSPSIDDVIIWETSVKAFSVRELPPSPSSQSQSVVGGESESSSLLDWVVLMMGPGKRLPKSELIGGYWSGREGAFGSDEKRPSGGDPNLIAQQGGWMATQSQLYRMNTGGLCQSTFLPPFDQPTYNHDGQESMNVEFWSGSYQFFTGVKGGCNMQRIISLRHPDDFSNHLIYHTANNKQRQLARERMVRADHLFGQLNTVKKMAIKNKQQSEKAKTN